ncbi:augurin-A [Mugil cephalus]|uniref:augurin-A n=1 Tax=Mugil cephalus TaxID=48193 RepID=UPI001FB7ACA4|nr:augurin-A [Mugil cephalus]
MACRQLYLRSMGLAVVLVLLALSDVSSDSTLHKILRKREVAEAGTTPSKSSVAVPPPKALEFLAKLRRTKRNLWDRSRPDVQQWIMQFMYMGYDEQRLETDLAYWMDHARANDQGRQHHYDENAAIAPRDTASYRHGANVNYDYY